MRYLHVFIGYDKSEKIAAAICKYSLIKHSSIPVKIKYLNIKNLRKQKLYTRKIDPKSSTEFTFSRFMTAYLSKYKGWSVYCDCDFLWLDDIKNLLKLKDNKYALMCVKHNYNPKSNLKFNNKKQYIYPRKNWSSMILWNNEHTSNKKLTLKKINSKNGKYLHRFGWLKDSEIGSISKKWNWLVGWYKKDKIKPKAIHFTQGGPWHKGSEDCDYSSLWKKYKTDFLKKKN